MSARHSSNLLPRQTPSPAPPIRQPRLKRRLSSARSVAPSAATSKHARQVLADQSQVGSCFISFSFPALKLIPPQRRQKISANSSRGITSSPAFLQTQPSSPSTNG